LATDNLPPGLARRPESADWFAPEGVGAGERLSRSLWYYQRKAA